MANQFVTRQFKTSLVRITCTSVDGTTDVTNSASFSAPSTTTLWSESSGITALGKISIDKLLSGVEPGSYAGVLVNARINESASSAKIGVSGNNGAGAAGQLTTTDNAINEGVLVLAGDYVVFQDTADRARVWDLACSPLTQAELESVLQDRFSEGRIEVTGPLDLAEPTAITAAGTIGDINGPTLQRITVAAAANVVLPSATSDYPLYIINDGAGTAILRPNAGQKINGNAAGSVALAQYKSAWCILQNGDWTIVTTA